MKQKKRWLLILMAEKNMRMVGWHNPEIITHAIMLFMRVHATFFLSALEMLRSSASNKRFFLRARLASPAKDFVCLLCDHLFDNFTL
jgi:hypothetical protein